MKGICKWLADRPVSLMEAAVLGRALRILAVLLAGILLLGVGAAPPEEVLKLFESSWKRLNLPPPYTPPATPDRETLSQ